MTPRGCFFAAAGILIGLTGARAAESGAPARPRVLGVAQVAYYVRDIQLSRKFYGGFLGYEEAFTLAKPGGGLRAALFKIDDRQTVELVPEVAPGTDRLHHIALETDDVEGMRLYLRSRGIVVPDAVTKGQVTAAYFSVKDPDGHGIEFVQYFPRSGMAGDAGRHLPAARVSRHLSHAGIMVRHLDAGLAFYRDILGGVVIRKGSGDGKRLSWVNVRVADGADWVEFMLYDQPPPLAKIGVNHHFCLDVTDAAQAAEILKARPLPPGASLSAKVSTGTDHKRKIQAFDPDCTRIEFMEPQTFDGLPSPWSDAPPPS